MKQLLDPGLLNEALKERLDIVLHFSPERVRITLVEPFRYPSGSWLVDARFIPSPGYRRYG
jgi:hypothetical protein